MAFLYVEDGGVWNYANEIIASNRPGDSFGYAVAIDDRIAISAQCRIRQHG